DAIARDTDVVRVLDGIHLAVGHAEPKEDAQPLIRVAAGIPQVLIEVVVDRPGLVSRLEGLGRYGEIGETQGDDVAQDGAGIGEAREAVLREERRRISRIL